MAPNSPLTDSGGLKVLIKKIEALTHNKIQIIT
jgi:hypothetical protein